MTEPKLPQFHELAEVYDAINSWKDYAGEAEKLETLARRFGRPRPVSWLDVACGTGRHLEQLRRKCRVVGVDASSEMLRIARQRLPGVRLVRADMRTFRLGARFDVVSCLYGAVGHLPNEADVRRTFANLSRHLNPGGVALVEPWILPSAWRSGHIDLRTYESPVLTVVRCAASQRRGNRSILHWHFLVGVPGRGIRHYEETDFGLLLSRNRLLRLFREVGLHPRYIARGLTPGRGLLLGIKRGPGASRPAALAPLRVPRPHP